MAKIRANIRKGKKHEVHLVGGPYDGHKIYLSGAGWFTSTFTFGVGKFYGRYVGNEWVEQCKT